MSNTSSHVDSGDQGNRDFLRELAQKIGPIDILLDDGGHQMHQMP